jgi:hypothetical protein
MKLFLKLLVSLLISIQLYGCKTNEQNVGGSYYLNRWKKTKLTLNNNGTFEFLNFNPLLIFKGGNYQTSSGYWQKASQTINLTSDRSALNYNKISVKEKQPKSKSATKFVFFDLYGDTVDIDAVKIGDSLVAMRFHKLLSSYETSEKEIKQKLHSFYFIGYKTFNFINNKERNTDYDITLSPEINESYFDETFFKIKKNKLVNKELSYKFIKIKK